jgi:outer membrane protein
MRALLLTSLLLLPIPALADPTPAAPALRLSLDEAVARFRDDAPSLAQLQARVDEARASITLATAGTLPIVAVQGSYTRNNAEVKISLKDTFDQLASSFPIPVDIDTSALPDALLLQPLQQWTGTASVVVPLVAAPAWSDIGAAKATVRGAEANAEATTANAEAALIRAAWLSGVAEDTIAAQEHALRQARALLDRARRREAAGLGTPLERLAAETEVSRRESELVQAVGDLDRAHRLLGAVIGVGGSVAITLPSLGESPGDPEDASRLALSSRPELDAAAASRDAARWQLVSAWSRHLPTLSANAGATASDVQFPTGLKTAWKVGLQLNWVLYDGGARYGLLDAARARRAQADAQSEQLRLDADREARDAAQGVDVALARWRLAAAALDTAGAAEAAADRASEAGLATHLEVMDAQQRRLMAAVGLAAAKAQVGVARAELARATGQTEAR